MATYIYILIIVGVLFVLLLFVSLLHPILDAKMKAARHGLDINWKEARSLSNFYVLSDDFLDDAKEIKDLDPSASIVTLADYYRTKPNFGTLIQDFEEARKTVKDISINSVILLNMADKDVKEALKDLDKIYELEIKGINENDLIADYRVSFKIEIEQSFWVKPDLDLLNGVLESRIKLALANSDLKEVEDESSYIINNYLDEDFWRVTTSGKVITQNLTLRA